MRAGSRVRRVAARTAGVLVYVAPPLVALVAALRLEPSLGSGAVAALVALGAVVLAGPMGSLAELLEPAAIDVGPRRSLDVRGSSRKAPEIVAADVLRDLDGYVDARAARLMSADPAVGGRNFQTVLATVMPAEPWPWWPPDGAASAGGESGGRPLAVVARSAGTELWPLALRPRRRPVHPPQPLTYPHAELYPERFGGVTEGKASPRRDDAGSGEPWNEGMDLVRLELEGLVRPWFVERRSRDALAAVLSARAVAALNAHGQDHVAVAFRPDSVTAFGDGDVSQLVGPKVAALASGLFAARQVGAGAGPVSAADGSDATARALAASAGGSAVLRGKESRGAAGLVTILTLAVTAVFLAIDASAGGGDATTAAGNQAAGLGDWRMPAAGSLCLAGVGLLALATDRGFDVRRVAMAKQVLALVKERGWRVEESAPPVVTPQAFMSRRGVRNVAVAPVAFGSPESGLRAGAAFLAWDGGWWPLLRGRSAWAVWVESERPLPAVEVIGARAGTLATLFGGGDARLGGELALARPGVVEALREVGSERLVIRSDGHLLVAWDRDTVSIDLAARVAAMTMLAAAIS